ncbi:MAG: hypothetical protein A2X51_02150 [Candidatus Rokubacteria bacterium GWC2_70_24]|nr:MAG: hypothetical protein A2X51_02150 [Candidatus Rokubacteria bacterium GWC2_70_24]
MQNGNGIDAATSRRLSDEMARLLKSGTVRGVRMDPVARRIEVRTWDKPGTWQPVNERSER